MTSLKSLDEVTTECEHIGKRVDVYFNLNKRIFSVRHKGIVIIHTPHLSLKDVTFVVSEKGRQKVIAKKCKNVHAVARGILVSVDKPVIAETSREITYLPYDHHSFFYAETRGTGKFEDVQTSPFVQCLGKKLYEPRPA